MLFNGLSDWVEIFIGGPQQDSSGRGHDGDHLIDRAVATFNPAYHEPPAVVGHPKHDSPAFGWVEGLKTAFRDGSKVLMAKFKDIAPEFEQAIREGRYRKRSAAFYPDGRLRHVGFLGAAAPAVKSLADLAFADDGHGAASFEFDEYTLAGEIPPDLTKYV